LSWKVLKWRPLGILCDLSILRSFNEIILHRTNYYQGKWYVSGLLDFRSQLLNGYGNYAHADTVYNVDGTIDEINTNPNRINTRTRVSQFAAPAYLTLSAGITCKPVSWVQMYLSPVAGKFTFVNPSANVFDAKTGGIGATAYGLENPTDVYRAESGWYFRGNLEKEVFKNVIVKTQIELFGNYLDNQHVDNIAATPKDTTGVNFYYNPATRSENTQVGTVQMEILFMLTTTV
jgi:hypothetical protein